jgi:O-antigen/teichoic acid export membrane protein
MNRVFENTSALFIAQLIGRLLSFGLMVILMPRYFTEEALGGYITAMSLTNMIAAIAELGMQSPLIREMALHRRQARHFLGNALIIRFLLSIIAFGLMVGIGYWRYQPIIVRMILLLGLSDIINSTAQLFRFVFRAFERMRYEAFTVVVERSLVVFVGGALIFMGIDLVNFCVVVLIASIFNLGLSVSIVVRRFMSLRFHVDLGICKALMRQALPFALGNICNLIYFRIDALLIRILSPHGVTANTWYGLAYQLVYAFTILPGAFMGAMFPVIARTFADNKRMDFGGIYTDALRLMFLVGVPFAVGMATLSGKISSVLFSRYEWAAIAPALRLLSWSGGLSFLTTVVITVLRATDKRRPFAILMATTALLNIGLNFILIPRFSHVGAAMAMIISEAYLFIGSFVYISQRISKLTYIGFAIKAVIVSTLMGTGLMFLRHRFSIWILIPCAILFYLAGMAAVGELRRGKIPKRMEFKEESSF